MTEIPKEAIKAVADRLYRLPAVDLSMGDCVKFADEFLKAATPYITRGYAGIVEQLNIEMLKMKAQLELDDEDRKEMLALGTFNDGIEVAARHVEALPDRVLTDAIRALKKE